MGKATDEELELLVPEHTQCKAIADLMEALREGLEVSVDRVLKNPFRVELHVFLAVLVCDGFRRPALHQLHSPHLPIVFVLDVEVPRKDLLDVPLVVQQLLQPAAKLGHRGLEVVELGLEPNQLLVRHHREVHIQDDVVVDGKPEQDADQPEVDVRLHGRLVEPVGPRLREVGEHPVVDVEELPGQQHEELPCDAALVEALLHGPGREERHLERLLEVLRLLHDLVEGVLEEVLTADADVEPHRLRRARAEEHRLDAAVVDVLLLLQVGLALQDAVLRLRREDEGHVAERLDRASLGVTELVAYLVLLREVGVVAHLAVVELLVLYQLPAPLVDAVQEAEQIHRLKHLGAVLLHRRRGGAQPGHVLLDRADQPDGKLLPGEGLDPPGEDFA
eukprot:CAMPEP_0177605562 /NCGR_PEP_ID=MMETSP0419_2-20121207/16776_1 /TAXON_ID=582737 /ORGANISM="Tetraselmis sp., Strain GSL018" /LENGTH=390 /DNA_ID=CAMNT_0019099737 /DNA_START=334 /DNA_END=1503 /DNA_ORIENTATION=-